MKEYIFILSFIVISLTSTHAQSRWAFELHSGQVYNLPMPLIVRQEGYDNIRLFARYASESFILPVYWDGRFSRWENGKSWELEAIHHKLYLKNTSSEK